MFNIVFMGTPDFAVPSLKALVESGENISAVFTQPDKPKGRGYKLIPTPIKAYAETQNLNVVQPTSLKNNDEIYNLLKEINPSLIVVVAYGQILPKRILEIPQYGCVNIHASLLPKYRGAAPIQWSILNGEKTTGITSMLMAEGLDTGDMLLKEELEIGENETSSELHDRLSILGSEVLIKTVEKLKNDEIIPQKQDDSKSTYASMITKEMSSIDFNDTAEKIHNTIRGITGYTYLNGKRFKMLRSNLLKVEDKNNNAGTIIDNKNFVVVCGDKKCIQLLEVQSEGGKKLTATDFLRGNKIDIGMKFEKTNGEIK